MKRLFYSCLGLMYLLLSGCKDAPMRQLPKTPAIPVVDTTVYTPYSDDTSVYKGFNSPAAINHIADIENAYFRNYNGNGTSYYGTVWREMAEYEYEMEDSISLFDRFRCDLGQKGDSMHCTIYAVEALRAGMGADFEKLAQAHKRIWRDREYAGWSIGYLLVRDFGWQAYLAISPHSVEYDQCVHAYRARKSYPVWRQPDIPLTDLFVLGEDDAKIDQLLSENEFGWGFSHQGIHTWFTRYHLLKECNWQGAPAAKYGPFSEPLFLKTPFLEYVAFYSHILIFPPKKSS